MELLTLRKDHPPGWGPGKRGWHPLAAWSVLVALGLYIAVSGPHRVHHIGEHAEQSDCLVWFLTQHTPGDASLSDFSPPLAPFSQNALLQRADAITTRPAGAFYARAPPQRRSSHFPSH